MTRSATGRGSSAPRPRPRRPPARSAHRTGKEGCAARGGIRLLGRNPAGAGRQPASVHQRRSKQALHQTAPQRARASRLSRQDARATKSGQRRDAGAAGHRGRRGPRSARRAPPRQGGGPAPRCETRGCHPRPSPGDRARTSWPGAGGSMSVSQSGLGRRSRVAGGGGAGSRAHGLLEPPGSTRWLLTAPVPGRLRLRCSAALTAAGHLHA